MFSELWSVTIKDMEQDKVAVWTEVDGHLRKARNIAHQLFPEVSVPVDSDDRETDWLSLYHQEEQRANEAVARLSKLKREAKLLQRKTEESIARIQSLAYRDALTGVANFHLLKEYIRSLASALPQGCDVVLVLIDLDRFHVINEILGSQIGDQLLVEVAQRLSGLVGQGDAVGRRGEDEFILVISNVPTSSVEQRFLDVADSVRSLLAEPVEIEGQKFQVTASVGGSSFPTLASDTESLIEQADSALSYVKKQGRDQCYFYNPPLKVHLKHNAALELQMPRALHQREFLVEYQPVLRRTRQGQSLVGVEAIVRWDNPVEGVLPPESFLPAADESGFIVPLGKWVLEQVCHQIKNWEEQGLKLFTSINLSGRQLLQANMVEQVVERVRALEVEPGSLVFEFRESHATLNEEYIDESLTGLDSAGFSLALDKFGSGFSSLNRLSKARYLKLSAELVEEDRELCQRALAVAKELEMVPVGARVESAGQAEALLNLGCAFVQGSFFSQSMSGSAVIEYSTSLT
jgi:diguanylate cyclase (GGDEF)-like protein